MHWRRCWLCAQDQEIEPVWSSGARTRAPRTAARAQFICLVVFGERVRLVVGDELQHGGELEGIAEPEARVLRVDPDQLVRAVVSVQTQQTFTFRRSHFFKSIHLDSVYTSYVTSCYSNSHFYSLEKWKQLIIVQNSPMNSLMNSLMNNESTPRSSKPPLIVFRSFFQSNNF